MRAHAELIKKWADDETMELEYLTSLNEWVPVKAPNWDLNALYREKPKEKKTMEMWQWAIRNGATPEKIVTSQFYANTDFLRQEYRPDRWQIICKIEGSKIEVEE